LADFLGAEGLPRTAISVLYNGIEPGPTEDQPARLRRRAELGVEADEFVVGTVARLDPVKDLATLLRAFALLTRDRRMTLMVVGDGPERGALEDLARDLGIAERVRFLGRRDDARDWLWACDAYVNSSISEGVSLTILEAMAASLPIVATRVGGTVEVVDAGSGRLVPARDPAALAEAIGALAASSAMRRTLGVWGRRRVDSLFNLERMVRDYRAVYVAGVH
jgi:glycosyltransferase involved in cell wall biosynthesis